MWITRRTALCTAAAFAAPAIPAFASLPPAFAPILEKKFGGKLGVSVLNADNGSRYAHRGDERFLMCSVSKLLIVGATLARVDAGSENLDRAIAYSNTDLLPHSPVTEAHVGEGHLTVRELCAAAIAPSDNTAANLLTAQLGGPAATTRYARSLGDHVTRSDRLEMALNRPDGDKDTTTPAAMLTDLLNLALGDVLKDASREALMGWLEESNTGDARIKAGIPADWVRIGKTGTGADISNDVVILTPSGARPPIVVAAFYQNAAASPETRDRVLMEVGRAVAANFG